MDNYLSAEPLILNRLKSRVIGVPQQDMAAAADLAEVTEKQQRPKAIYVQYFDDALVSGDKGRTFIGQAVAVDQLWLVVVMVRNVSDTSGSQAREDAGPIVLEVLKSLQGFVLSKEHGALQRRNSPYRTTFRNGFCYVPLLFAARVSVTGYEN